jgi:IS30 family transposase
MAGRRLSLEEREEIVVGPARKESVRQIAARLGWAPSTVSREVRRNLSSSPRRYGAFPAHIVAAGRARRRRPRRLGPARRSRRHLLPLHAWDLLHDLPWSAHFQGIPGTCVGVRWTARA